MPASCLRRSRYNFIAILSNIHLRLPSRAYVGRNAFDGRYEAGVIDTVCVTARKKHEKLFNHITVKFAETHDLHHCLQFLAVDAAVAVDVYGLKSSSYWTLAPAARSAVVKPATRIDFVGEVECKNLKGGWIGELGAAAKMVAVVGVKSVLPRIQAKIFLIRCQELAAPGEVPWIATNDAAAQHFDFLIGMQVGACCGLHLWFDIWIRGCCSLNQYAYYLTHLGGR